MPLCDTSVADVLSSPLSFSSFANLCICVFTSLGPGFLHFKDLSLASVFNTFHTRPADEYGVWSVNNSNAIAVPPFSARFSTTLYDGHALLIGDEDGILTVLDSRRSLNDQMRHETQSLAPPSRFIAHSNAIFDAVWIADDSRVATASGDGTVRVFDPETLFRTAMCRGAKGSVKCVRAFKHSSGAILVSSGRDGAIRLHDTRMASVYDPSVCAEAFHKPVLEVDGAHTPPLAMKASPSKRRRIAAPDRPASVTSIALLPGREHLMFSSGAADGSIKLWDVRAGDSDGSRRKADAGLVSCVTPSEEQREDFYLGKRRRHGIASLDLDETGSKLLASSTGSSIFIYDTNQLELGYYQKLRGHTATSFYVRASFSPCGRFVASGSADSKGYIWDLEQYGTDGVQPILQLDGHRGGEVAVVEWCKSDRYKVATCGDDTTVKVWTADSGFQKEEGSISEGYGIARCLPSKRCGESLDSGSSGSLSRLIRRPPSRRLRDADIRTFFGNRSNIGTSPIFNNNSNTRIENINSSSYSSESITTTKSG